MNISNELRWFQNVYWEKQKRSVDCLVDVTQTKLRKGQWLIEVHGKLKITNVADLQQFVDKAYSFSILGEVKQYDRSF